MKNNTVLEGIFISYFRGAEESGDPFIIKWHFLDKKDTNDQSHLISFDGSEDYGKIINQEDIKSIKFKE